MSEQKTEVAAENLTKIGGGDCTAQDYMEVIGQLTDAYNELVEFTSYVIGRVSGTE